MIAAEVPIVGGNLVQNTQAGVNMLVMEQTHQADVRDADFLRQSEERLVPQCRIEVIGQPSQQRPEERRWVLAHRGQSLERRDGTGAGKTWRHVR